jgi:hypothetical protein
MASGGIHFPGLWFQLGRRLACPRPQQGGSYAYCCGGLPRAVLIQLINDFSSKGLLRNATAPAFNARVRDLSSGKADMTMTGVSYPAAFR